MDLNEGKTTDDIANIDLGGEWADFTPFSYYETYDDTNPWEFTIDPLI